MLINARRIREVCVGPQTTTKQIANERPADVCIANECRVEEPNYQTQKLVSKTCLKERLSMRRDVHFQSKCYGHFDSPTK
jgi:hypothetical protein